MNALYHATHWRNWVGNQSCVATERAAPTSESELCDKISSATQRGLNVRCAGSGHSFTPVVVASGLLLSLSGMKGIGHVDTERKRVTACAGTSINEVSRHLKAHGLSMVNQGDIDTQALAGALTTGTHGTGARLGNLAVSIVGMKLVQPDGEILIIDESTPDVLNATRVSLGTLGVISEITLQLMDAYHLHERIWRDDFDTCMERHDELAAKHRHFSFFWCPIERSRHCYCLPDTAANSSTSKTFDVCEMKVMDMTDAPPMQSEFEKIAYSSEIYPIEYIANFHELEYAVPVEYGKEACKQVRRLMLDKYPDLPR